MMTGGRNSNFNSSDVYGLSASKGPTPRLHCHNSTGNAGHYPAPNPGIFSPDNSKSSNVNGGSNTGMNAKRVNGEAQVKQEDGSRDLHMFVWSSSASPVSDVFGNQENRVAVSPGNAEGFKENRDDYIQRDEFSFGNRAILNENGGEKAGDGRSKTMPSTSVMTRLILIMGWRKLIRNPKTYSSLFGLTWSLVSFRFFAWFSKTKDESFICRSCTGG